MVAPSKEVCDAVANGTLTRIQPHLQLTKRGPPIKMSGNAAFLSGLKKTTETREKQFQSKIWGTIFVIGSVVATYFADGEFAQFVQQISIADLTSCP